MSDDLKARVERALAEHVGPALAMDGAAIEVLDVTGGVARVRLAGVCGGCPSTVMAVLGTFGGRTLSHGFDNKRSFSTAVCRTRRRVR